MQGLIDVARLQGFQSLRNVGLSLRKFSEFRIGLVSTLTSLLPFARLLALTGLLPLTGLLAFTGLLAIAKLFPLPRLLALAKLLATL